MRIAAAVSMLLALLLPALPVKARDAARDAWPATVQAAIDEAKQVCGAPVRMRPGFVTARDINGDGQPDYVLDYDKFDCGDTITFFCGSAGCLTQVFASLPDGRHVKAWDDNVRAIRFTKLRNRPAMILDLHGSACGKVGSAACAKSLFWNGSSFGRR